MLLPVYDGVSALPHAIQKAGDVEDTTKVAAACSQALPMPSIQDDELTLGGSETFGADREIMTTIYIGVIRNGEPVVLGKVK